MPGIVLHIDSNHPVLWERLEASGYTNVAAYTESLEELRPHLAEATGLIVRSRLPIDATFLEAAPRLRWIGRVGSGLENIDLRAAEARGIQVYHAAEGNQNAVGEHALGMLLSLLNRVHLAYAEMQQGIWLRAENRGYELEGKTVGIIGYGRMGQSFARKLSGFDCLVLAYDLKPNLGNANATQVELPQLQAEADIISLHLPLDASTHHFVDEAFIQQCAQPFWLINTARGPVIDTAAVVAAVQQGRIRGACLDVHEFESRSFEHVQHSPVWDTLLHDPRFLLTPHIAGWTHESYYKLSAVLAEKVINGK